MLPIIFLLACAWGDAPDPAYQPLERAYAALRAKNYDQAIEDFEQALGLAPGRPAIHKDLAYTLLKIGENEAARDQFGEAMRLDPSDSHVAMEYAFLCYETKQQAVARRVFDRIRKSGNPTAEQAFLNIDRPLAEGIERWRKALEQSPDNFSAHHELAKLAEQRDEFALAAEHYQQALRLKPEERSLLLDLGRVWKALGRNEQSFAALLAASRGTQARVSEQARELLPARYPYVYEFEAALRIDPKNIDLHRELAYLLLEMNKKQDAEREFQTIVAAAPDDALSAAQLRLLHGQTLKAATATERKPDLGEAKTLGEKSLKAGYMKDALKYLQSAHETDPVDFQVMLDLGWAYNILRSDADAIRWFDLARKSPDPAIASQAGKAYNNLRPAQKLVRTTVWAFPVFSTRWHDAFGYAQVKTEFKLGKLPFRPYVGVRLDGDLKGTLDTTLGPQYLSQTSVIFALGVASIAWHGANGWFEAGEAVNYLPNRKDVGTAIPDYRGGLSYAKGFGHPLNGGHGWFAESNDDGVFVSRFANDFLMYSQNRTGYTLAPLENVGFEPQIYWNYNLTGDTKRQYWANFVETGPGLRLKVRSAVLSANFVRGVYLVNQGNPRRPNYFDFRVGIWYAFTR